MKKAILLISLLMIALFIFGCAKQPLTPEERLARVEKEEPEPAPKPAITIEEEEEVVAEEPTFVPDRPVEPEVEPEAVGEVISDEELDQLLADIKDIEIDDNPEMALE